MSDEHFMARAFVLAGRGQFTTSPNPNVGCVIVQNSQIVGEGWHQRTGGPHAEIIALAEAGNAARGATAYITLEPCSHHGHTAPCCDALIKAGVVRVVAAIQDPNPLVAGRGFYCLQQAGINVDVNLMSGQAEKLNRGFFKRMRTGFPFVQLKMAMTLDGRTALANGASKWITSPSARQDVQRLRAQSCAILTGSGTVLQDDPQLNVRWRALDAETQSILAESSLRQPVRVVIDSQNRINATYRIMQQPGKTWLARLSASAETLPPQVENLLVPARNNKVDLVALMMLLGQRGINMVWVEAGATLAGALIEHALVDELIVYMAPKLLGNSARALCNLDVTSLESAPHYAFSDVRTIGSDVRLILAQQASFD